VGVAVGIANGLAVTWLKVTPLIATLAMGTLLVGVGLLITGGAPKGSIAPAFAAFGSGHAGGIPLTLIVWAGVAVAVGIAMASTWGRRVYAAGANGRAAYFAGVRVRTVTVSAYALSGLLAALAGLLLVAYSGSPSLGVGDQYIFESIAAAAVGGTLLSGGIGSIAASTGGAVFLSILTSFTTALHVAAGSSYIVQGVVIVVALLAYRLHRSRRRLDGAPHLQQQKATKIQEDVIKDAQSTGSQS